MAHPVPDPRRDCLYYFAYGSNLDPGTFLGRRRMRPASARPGCLNDWALTFDLPIGPGERGVGNVQRRPGVETWGVVYQLDFEDAARLDRSEGLPHGAYRRVAVEVACAEGPFACFTYHAASRDPGRMPSRRYLGLILTGARHHGLPAHYVEALRALPLAVDERDPQIELPLE